LRETIDRAARVDFAKELSEALGIFIICNKLKKPANNVMVINAIEV